MKLLKLSFLAVALSTPILLANPADDAANNDTSKKRTPEEVALAQKTHQQAAIKLSLEQDDLSADVQDLIDEQTDPKVVELLSATEITMAEATDLLEQTNTDGTTIAVQTEVIEKIFDAAKKKKQGSDGQGEQKDMGSMLDMMKNMMDGGKDVGKKPGEGKPGEGKGAGEGGGGGKGSGSASGKTGSADNTDENSTRRVPKSSGNSGDSLPREFQKAMDAYNKSIKTSKR